MRQTLFLVIAHKRKLYIYFYIVKIFDKYMYDKLRLMYKTLTCNFLLCIFYPDISFGNGFKYV